jgi:hypothetical protein
MSGELGGRPAESARPEIYPMTREQEALWLDDFVWDGPSRHLEAWACRLTGQLDTGALEWAVSQVISRHEVLRTRLTERDEEPVQIVTAPRPVRMEQLSCPPEALQAELGRIAAEPLDLNEAPIRPWLVCVSPDDFVLVVQFHHAVVDGWSLNIFQREVMHFYTARLHRQSSSLEPLPMQVGDLAVAQRAAGLDPTDVAYWRERVKGAPTSCTIPADRPGSEELSHRVARFLFEISPERGQAVRAAARAQRTTPFTLFTAAMAALLWQYGEPDEVIFGTPVSLRGAAAVDGMIGCLMNLLPIRLAVSRGTSFRTLASAAKAEVLGAIEHRAVPYPAIVRMSRHGMAADAPAPCDVALVVDDMRWEPFSLPKVSVDTVRLPCGYAKFALLLSLVAGDDGGYAGTWNYDTEIFDAVTVARVAGQFTELLARCVVAPDQPIGRILGSAAEGSRD